MRSFRGITCPPLCRVPGKTPQLDRKLTIVLSSPLADADASTIARNWGGSWYLDGVFRLTVYDDQIISLLAEYPWTFMGCPISCAFLTVYTLKPVAGEESTASLISGASKVELSADLPDVREVLACDKLVAPDPEFAAIWDVAFAELSKSLPQVASPAAEIDENRLPLHSVAYTTLRQLSSAWFVKSLRPSFLLMDQEANLWRGARLWQTKILMHVFCKHLQSIAPEIHSALGLSCVLTAAALKNVRGMSVVDTLLRTSDVSHLDAIPVAIDTALVVLARRVFSDAFVDAVLLLSYSGINLLTLVLALLLYDICRIRALISPSVDGRTTSIALMGEWMDDLLCRWQVTMRKAGPLCFFSREFGVLRIEICHFHALVDWSKQLKANPPQLKESAPEACQVQAIVVTALTTDSPSIAVNGDAEDWQDHALPAAAHVVGVGTAFLMPTELDVWDDALVSLVKDLRAVTPALSQSDFAAILTAAVVLQGKDVIYAPSESDFVHRSKSFLAALKIVWPYAHAYFKKYYLSERTRSLIGLAWRKRPHYSDATGVVEAIQRRYRARGKGIRSRDPAWPLAAGFGHPSDALLTSASLVNQAHARNAVHSQQRGSTNAGLRDLRINQKAALMYASALMGVNGASITAVESQLAFDQKVVIHFEGVRTLFLKRRANSTQGGASSAAALNATALLVDTVLPALDLAVTCPSATVTAMLLRRRDRIAKKLERCAVRIEFVVDILRGTCSCEKLTTGCACRRAGQLWAREQLHWPASPLDDDETAATVGAIARSLVDYFRLRAFPLPSARIRSALRIAKGNLAQAGVQQRKPSRDPQHRYTNLEELAARGRAAFDALAKSGNVRLLEKAVVAAEAASHRRIGLALPVFETLPNAAPADTTVTSDRRGTPVSEVLDVLKTIQIVSKKSRIFAMRPSAVQAPLSSAQLLQQIESLQRLRRRSGSGAMSGVTIGGRGRSGTVADAKRRRASAASPSPRPAPVGTETGGRDAVDVPRMPKRPRAHGRAQYEEVNGCYYRAVNAAVTRLVGFASFLVRTHECNALLETLTSLARALPKALIAAKAVCGAAAMPLTAALVACMSRTSKCYAGAAAARQLNAVDETMRAMLAAAAARIFPGLVVIVDGDRAFAPPQPTLGSAAPVLQAALMLLPTPALSIPAIGLRSLCRHDRVAPLRYPAGMFALNAAWGTKQQCAGEYLDLLLRRCAYARDPTVAERRELPRCCQYLGFNSTLSTVSVTCHGPTRHTWVPVSSPGDGALTTIVLPIPGPVASDHVITDSVSLDACFQSLLSEDVGVSRKSDGRECTSCGKTKVAYTRTCLFDSLPQVLALQLGRSANTAAPSSLPGFVGAKNFKHVALPKEFDAVPYAKVGTAARDTLDAAGGRLDFRLMSIVVHHGTSLRGGHYTAYCRSGPGSGGVEWELWNDSFIFPSSWADVCAAPAYLAFYEVVNAGLLEKVFPTSA